MDLRVKDSLRFKIYREFIKIFNLTLYPVLSIKEYSKIGNVSWANVTEQREGLNYEVRYLGDKDEILKHNYILNPIKHTTFYDVCIQSESDVVLDDVRQLIINDFCYNQSAESFFVDGWLYRNSKNWALLRNTNVKKVININAGVLISGKFSYNYYHQLTENLIRLIYLQEVSIPLDVPFLIDKKTFQVSSFKKIFDYLTQYCQRDVIQLEKGFIYHVGELYTIDHPNYLAPHLRNIITPHPELCIYDGKAMKKERELLLRNKIEWNCPKRIFITRKNTAHRRFNEDELFDYLKEKGFERVAPEELTFEQQINMFNEAEWIIGASGAAFTNIMFCKPGCNIVCLRSTDLGFEPSVFFTIACIMGCNMWYYAPQRSRERKSVHSDFIIDVKDFKTKIDSFL